VGGCDHQRRSQWANTRSTTPPVGDWAPISRALAAACDVSLVVQQKHGYTVQFEFYTTSSMVNGVVLHQMNQRTPSPVQPVRTEQHRMEQKLASNCGFGVIARLFDTLWCGVPLLDRRVRPDFYHRDGVNPLLTSARHAVCRGGSIVNIMTPRMSAKSSGPGTSKYTASISDDHVALSRDTARTSS
jgi:hypothetical protein